MRTLTLGCAAIVIFAGCGRIEHAPLEWQYTGGPLAQNVAQVLPDARQPEKLLSVLHDGDLYAPGEDGTAWRRISTLKPWIRVHSLVQDPENPDLIYAATDAGLLVSRTRGKEWEPAGTTESGSVPCRVLAIDPWKTSTLYCGTRERGILKSTNGGSTWEACNGGDSLLPGAEVLDIKVDVTRPDAVVAAAWGIGALRSTDGGAAWRRITEEFPASGSAITHIALHPRMNNTIVYATDAGTIARTTNGGETWSITKREDEAWRVLTLAADPANPEVLFAGTESGIIRTSDFGATWSRVAGNLPPLPTSLALGPGRPFTTLYAYGAGIGVQRSTDGGANWHSFDADLGGATIAFVTGDTGGEGVYAATGSALLKYNAAGGTWEAASSGLSGGNVTSVAFDPDSPVTISATTTGGAFRSTNGGWDWSPIARNVRMMPRFIETHPTIKTRMLASGVQGAFVSTDRGNSWSQAKPAGNRFNFRAMTFTPKNAGIIHAATPSQGVLMTTDGGLSWEQARYGISSDSILAVTLDDQDGLTYFAWTSSAECFRSTNRGLEWSKYAPPWMAGERVAIAYDRLNPSSVVALVNGQELYFSLSGGTSWVKVLEQKPGLAATSLYWNARSGKLYAGTEDRGVYVIDLRSVLDSMLEE